MKIAGIDEAGRGPIIGPMIMAVVVADEKDEDTLREWGVKDSKLLTPMMREGLFERIKEKYKHAIIILSPQDIDDALNDPNNNLNWLEAQTSAKLLSKIKAKKAYLDCPSTNVEAYNNYVKKLVKNIEIVSEHGADATYPVCSAASILAKVTRDREIEKLKQKINKNFGSGYPSDPRTQEFLKKYYDKPEGKGIIRTSWETYKKLVNSKKQSKLNSF